MVQDLFEVRTWWLSSEPGQLPQGSFEGCRSKIPKDLALSLLHSTAIQLWFCTLSRTGNGRYLKETSLRKSCWNSWGITEAHIPTKYLVVGLGFLPLFWDGEQLIAAPRVGVTAIAQLMNLAWSLSWLHHYCCPIIREDKVSTTLCKFHQEIVSRNRWAHVVGRLGSFMLERHSCRKARGNQCNSKVSRLSLSCSIPGVSCQGKRASSHICLALTCPCFQSDPLFIEL